MELFWPHALKYLIPLTPFVGILHSQHNLLMGLPQGPGKGYGDQCSSSSDNHISRCDPATYQLAWAVAELLCLHFLICRKGTMSTRYHGGLRRISGSRNNTS